MKKVTILMAVASVLVLSGAQVASAGHLADGLVGYWGFDDNTDATPDDEAHGNNGTINGGAAYANGVGIAPVSGNVDALTFDGLDDFVEVAHADVLDLTAAYSISVWVNVTDVPSNTYRPILFRGATDVNDIEVYIQAVSNDLVVAHNRGNGGTFDHVRFTDPPVGSLFHLVVTFAGTNVQAYYDGVAATANQSTGALAMTSPLDTDRGWWIGKVDHTAFGTLAGGSDINLFKGLLDEVRVYDRVLTGDEIDALGDYSNFDISLSPATDFNPLGTNHTVTATLSPALSFIPVLFEVTGANPTTGSDLTGDGKDDDGDAVTEASGEATFDYIGTNAGVDTITACVDLDDDGTCEPGDGEPTDTATKEWLDQWVTGGGKINFTTGNTNKAEWTFGGMAGTFDDGAGGTIVRGQFQITEHGSATPCHFVVTGLSVISSTEVKFVASGDCGDVTVTIKDVAEPGKDADTILVEGDIVINAGAGVPETIDGGNFQVHIED